LHNQMAGELHAPVLHPLLLLHLLVSSSRLSPCSRASSVGSPLIDHSLIPLGRNVRSSPSTVSLPARTDLVSDLVRLCIKAVLSHFCRATGQQRLGGHVAVVVFLVRIPVGAKRCLGVAEVLGCSLTFHECTVEDQVPIGCSFCNALVMCLHIALLNFIPASVTSLL